MNAVFAKTGEITQNAEKLREGIVDYLDIKELMPFIAAKRIVRILVGHKKKLKVRKCRRLPLCGGLPEKLGRWG